jgi:hypothetical protein
MTKLMRIEVRLSIGDRDAIRLKAQIAKISMSQYFLRAALGRQIKPVLPDDVRRAIGGWSRNLNQLSHHANLTGTAAQVQELERLRESVVKLLRTIAEL